MSIQYCQWLKQMMAAELSACRVYGRCMPALLLSFGLLAGLASPAVAKLALPNPGDYRYTPDPQYYGITPGGGAPRPGIDNPHPSLPAATGGVGAVSYTLAPQPSYIQCIAATRQMAGTPHSSIPVGTTNLTYSAVDSANGYTN